MIEQPKIATRKGDPDKFTGDVYIDTVVQSAETSLVRATAVHFPPGAPPAGHSHARGQSRQGVEVTAPAPARDDDVRAVRPGDTVYTAPGVWHWHGAPADQLMTHLAIWQAPEAGAESDWGEHVTDEEYGRR